MDWEQRILEALRASRSAWDEPPDWRVVLGLYDGLDGTEAAALDAVVLRMVDLDYRSPHASGDPLPFDDVMVNLPGGMTPDDLLCIEAATLVAAERGLGPAYFRLNAMMRAPVWHPLQGRLHWLSREGFDALRRLALTREGRGFGALLGLAAGDALGCSLEFMSRQEIRQAYPAGHREIIGGGPFGFAAGEWTDDTDMALAVAEGIIASPADPVPAVGQQFMAWYHRRPPDIGGTCRLALATFGQTGSWAETTATVARRLGDQAGGNGALMRTLPTALAYGPSTDKAVAIARMTHPHPESDAAVAVYHRMVDRLLDGAPKVEAWAAGLAVAGPLAGRLERLPQLTEGEIRSGGYVVETLEAAVWCFLQSESLEACIVQAVNLGDDTDTVGAVAGGLAGAFYGPAAIPRRWSLALQGRDRLERAAQGLAQVCTHNS